MKARKRFGQHFLEPAWVVKLVAAIAAKPDDAFLEIGPGRGAITRPLAQHCLKLLAIEVDRDLAAELDADTPANVTVVQGDVLKTDLTPTVAAWLGAPPSPSHPLRVVGNLPYNISSPILFRLLNFAAETGGLLDATLMLQKEVADRLVARVGTREYGVLTVLTSLHADVTRVLSLPPGAFRPAPKVHSAVVRLTFRAPSVKLADPDGFVRMVRAVFTQRRKTIGNALKTFAAESDTQPAGLLKAAGIDARRRPETLDLKEFATLSNAISGPRENG
jgi:16S rRNA (adenine1518-N6/adenine1519-N6)-dimethyltransferase